jgi:hypothetical protein
MSTAARKLYLFLAIDRASKFAYAELHERAHKVIAAEFLCYLMTQVLYKLHTVLTDHGIQFTNRKTDYLAFSHIFGGVCQEHGFEQRLTQVNLLWSNG